MNEIILLKAKDETMIHDRQISMPYDMTFIKIFKKTL